MRNERIRLSLGIAALLLLGLRFFHFGSVITQPHAWRQCDTAFFARDFYQNGIDLLHPSVCWMGNRPTVVLEFPLPEAVMALGYQLTGGEQIWIARLITLLFFLGSAFFFWKIVKRIWGTALADWAALLYLAFPLSQYYSTAVHIDFSALFFAYGMAFFFLKGIGEKRGAWLLASSAMGVLAFLIKAPYAFFLALPLLAYVFQRKRFSWFLPYAPLFLLPVLALGLWQLHSQAVNGAMPDWDFILHYRKFDHNSSWYFGDLALRFNWISWKLLIQRWWLDMAGILGTGMFLIGLASWRKHCFATLWLLGAGIYVLIFFNLNRIHDYYQLPLLAPLAIFMALGLQRLSEWLSEQKMPAWLPGLFLLLMLGEYLFYAESRYYKVDEALVEIGRQIAAHTPEGALPIVTYRNFDCRNPQILYRSHRQGWSIEQAALNAEVLRRLGEEGATHWVCISPQGPPEEVKNHLTGKIPEKIPLFATSDTLFIYSLP